MKPDINCSKLTLIPTHIWSKDCIACGVENPYGLHMQFYSDGEFLTSKLKINERFRGWDNVTHGGITGTILDEIMAWNIIYLKRQVMLTKSMTINYHTKVLTGEVVEIFSHINSFDGREATVYSELYNSNGELSSDATGIYYVFSIKVAKKLKIMSEESLAGLNYFFETCDSLIKIKSNKES